MVVLNAMLAIFSSIGNVRHTLVPLVLAPVAEHAWDRHHGQEQISVSLATLATSSMAQFANHTNVRWALGRNARRAFPRGVA